MNGVERLDETRDRVGRVPKGRLQWGRQTVFRTAIATALLHSVTSSPQSARSTSASLEADVCGAPEALPCDVREPTCQWSLFRRLACLRGVSNGDLPAVQVHSPESARSLRREAARGVNPAQPVMQSELEASPPAFYLLDRHLIVVESRGHAWSSCRMDALLAHELVHAQRRGQTSLPRIGGSTLAQRDRRTARAALLEGEAKLYELLVRWVCDRQGPDVRRFFGVFRGRARRMERIVADQKVNPSQSFQSLGYVYGAALVARAWVSHGSGGIDTLLHNPPSTEDLVHRVRADLGGPR